MQRAPTAAEPAAAPARGARASKPTKPSASFFGKLARFVSPPEIRKFRALDRLLRRQFSEEELARVHDAFIYGHEAHINSYRASGEPYITHPLEVAVILAQMKMDCPTIVAAILHDVLEDTEVKRDDIESKFGEEISTMVDGLSKLDRLNFKSPNEALRASYSKMFIAMARDIRLVFIKLADRLHNLRTLGFVAKRKQERIANETLNLYVPLATRLGMHRLRLEMEDLCLKALHPFRYKVIAEKLADATRQSRKLLKETRDFLCKRLAEYGIEAEIIGRTKSVYSCHLKMRDKRLRFDEINDINAMRIIVGSVNDCYCTLGVVHNNYAPIPGKFKDYIASSKFNGYQSLHTTVHTSANSNLEVQIRTTDMDRFAESGIASYWMYKVNVDVKSKAIAQANAWISALAEMGSQGSQADGALSMDLFDEDDIFVFSPNNDTVCLPRHATALDFAYAIHTEIGHSSVSALIDKRPAPLHTALHSGQTVAIITNERKSTPNPNRLNYVRTLRARNAILQQLNQVSRQYSVMLGHDLLAASLRQHRLSLSKKAVQAALDSYVKTCGYESRDELFRDIGLGNRLSQLSARSLADMVGAGAVEPALPESADHTIKGIEGLNYHLSKCCQPIPDDAIVGVQSRGHGLVIHRSKCGNVSKLQARNPELCVDLLWGERQEGKLFRCTIRVIALDQKGALARISTAVADMNVNIVSVVLKEKAYGEYVTIPFLIEVADRGNLARIIRGVRRIDVVRNVARI